MRTASLLLAIAASAPAVRQEGKPTLEEMIERVRAEKDRVEDDLLHQIGVWRNETAFEALGGFRALLGSAAKKRQVVHEFRHFAGTPLAGKAIETLRKVALAPADSSEGKEAVDSLASFEGAAAEALRAVAREKGDFVVRAEAIGKLAALEIEADAALFLEVANSDAAPALRGAAIRALGPDPRAEGASRRALSDPSAIVRGAALGARASLRDPAAIALAREIASDAREKGWSPVVGAIAVLGAEGSAESARLLLAIGARTATTVRAAALRAIRGMEPAGAIAAAEAALDGKDRGAASFAVEALGGMPSPLAGRGLRRALNDSDPAIVAAAANALGARGDPAAVTDLRKETSNPDPSARAAVIGALTDLQPGDPEWRKRLFQFAEDGSPPVRIAVALSLGRHGGEGGLATLERLLVDREGAVRAAAIEALGTARLRRSIPLLIARLKKEPGRLREDLARALRRITGQAFGRWVEDWERWWGAEGEAFVVPPLAEVEAKARALAQARAVAETGTFYGLEVVSNRVVFVIDSSGSMAEPTGTAAPGRRGESRYEVARRELRGALEGLLRAHDPRVNVVLFATNSDDWHGRLQPLDAPAVEAATRYVAARTPNGATNLHDGLERAFADPDVDTIYLLSDGAPTAGEITDAALLSAEVRRWNRFRRIVIHGVSIGASSPLLENLAADSGGKFVKR